MTMPIYLNLDAAVRAYSQNTAAFSESYVATLTKVQEIASRILVDEPSEANSSLAATSAALATLKALKEEVPTLELENSERQTLRNILSGNKEEGERGVIAEVQTLVTTRTPYVSPFTRLANGIMQHRGKIGAAVGAAAIYSGAVTTAAKAALAYVAPYALPALQSMVNVMQNATTT